MKSFPKVGLLIEQEPRGVSLAGKFPIIMYMAMVRVHALVRKWTSGKHTLVGVVMGALGKGPKIELA